MSNILTSWRTTLGGLAMGVLLFLSSYLQNGNTINLKDPKFWAALVAALWGAVQKDANVTGGTTLAAGAIPDSTLHQQAAVAAANAVTKV